ncbi:MAG: hypothetical protein U0930_13480 [Pirellulales bacterium]
MTEAPSRIDAWSKLIQALSVIIGVAVSVVTYYSAREKEALARQIEAQAPFLKLRQERYVEIGQVVATLVSHEPQTKEYASALTRFRELYIIQLTMVESPEVASKMVELAHEIDPSLLNLKKSERIALGLAGALQRSFCGDLGMGQVPVSTKFQGD